MVEVKEIAVGKIVKITFPPQDERDGFCIVGKVYKQGVGNEGINSKGGLTVLKIGETTENHFPILQPVHGTSEAELVE